MFAKSKAADLNQLVQGVQLYWTFPFSKGSLLELKHIILHKIKLVLRQVQINVNCAKVRKETRSWKQRKLGMTVKSQVNMGRSFFNSRFYMIQLILDQSFGPSFIVELDRPVLQFLMKCVKYLKKKHFLSKYSIKHFQDDVCASLILHQGQRIKCFAGITSA
jgi:hypothetical protein